RRMKGQVDVAGKVSEPLEIIFDGRPGAVLVQVPDLLPEQLYQQGGTVGLRGQGQVVLDPWLLPALPGRCEAIAELIDPGRAGRGRGADPVDGRVRHVRAPAA